MWPLPGKLVCPSSYPSFNVALIVNGYDVSVLFFVHVLEKCILLCLVIIGICFNANVRIMEL